MVGCISIVLLEVLPFLNYYFHPAEDMLLGVGDIGCKVYGELRNVPLCLGTKTEAGTALKANFRVIEGFSYSILFGLDLLVPINGKVHLKNCILEFNSALKQ